MTRKGDWIQTYTGRQFWPLDPRPDEIFIEDIAHALSMSCRFTGHCSKFYSVAEHSILLSQQVLPNIALWGLLHDASEAYLCDLARPVKRVVSGYAEAEASVMRAICERFELSIDMPSAVKIADESMLATEQLQLMKPAPAPWFLRHPPYALALHCWTPDEAERRFLSRFEELT